MDPNDVRDISGEMLRVSDAAKLLGLTEAELRRIYALGGIRGGFAPTGTLLLQKADVERLAHEMEGFLSPAPKKLQG